MGTMYGYDVTSHDDHMVAVSDKAIELASRLLFPGETFINMFPILQHIPAWFPGAKSQRTAAYVNELTTEMKRTPMEFVKNKMAEDSTTRSLVAQLLEDNNARGGSKEVEGAIEDIAGTAYGAASDTTISSSGAFFYAMTLNPEVQKKAQGEIDRVIGSERLPQFEDRISLPYIEAIFREVMRWRPPLPLSLPHAVIRDDVYNGYFIPKGKY